MLRVKVLPGARVPADGEVAEGRSYIDESMITGESRPVSKAPGQAVIGGTVNNSNILIIKVCPLLAVGQGPCSPEHIDGWVELGLQHGSMLIYHHARETHCCHAANIAPQHHFCRLSRASKLRSCFVVEAKESRQRQVAWCRLSLMSAPTNGSGLLRSSSAIS